MKTIDVYNAALETYRKFGNEDYAVSKANSFVRRCLLGKESDPDFDIPRERIVSVVYAALDQNAEDVFWWYLDEAAV